ncbi:MAG TPA: patatin-like phospholipase family protein [Arenicellales bacterium]|nr:patatin-like phospholipase family protein [Arenicellales bacterium]
MSTKTSVSLVLGSGGARGLAHIGVIEWLEENGYEIKSISGSSMGALVGGIYAAGELDTYKHWVTALDRSDVVRMLDPSFGWSGLLKGERIINKLRNLIGDREIESLPISYTAVATDVERGKEVWLSRGSLFDAIRASIAVPLVFTPHEINGRKLLDGGLLNPLPVAPTLRDQNDITIAVNVDGPPSRATGPRARPDADENGEDTAAGDDHDAGDSYRTRIKSFIQEMQDKLTPERKEDWGFFDIMMLSIETMQSSIVRMKMAPYTPDYYLVIARDAAGAYEFHRARELIQLGRDTAESNLPG